MPPKREPLDRLDRQTEKLLVETGVIQSPASAAPAGLSRAAEVAKSVVVQAAAATGTTPGAIASAAAKLPGSNAGGAQVAAQQILAPPPPPPPPPPEVQDPTFTSRTGTNLTEVSEEQAITLGLKSGFQESAKERAERRRRNGEVVCAVQ